MLWTSELFSWDNYLFFEPCRNIFFDHELHDLFIDTWEAAIVYVGEKSSVYTQISSCQRPIIAFLVIDIDQTKLIKWLLNILWTIRQALHVYIWLRDVFRLVTSVRQRKTSEFPWGIELQTFRAPSLSHREFIMKFICHTSCILLGPGMSIASPQIIFSLFHFRDKTENIFLYLYVFLLGNFTSKT